MEYFWEYQFLLVKTRQVFRVNSLDSKSSFRTKRYQWSHCCVMEFYVNVRLLT